MCACVCACVCELKRNKDNFIYIGLLLQKYI